MKELKTLEDIYHCGIPKEETIKVEALKWLNELDHEFKGREEDGAIEFIVKFFNLTEEDLKENEEWKI